MALANGRALMHSDNCASRPAPFVLPFPPSIVPRVQEAPFTIAGRGYPAARGFEDLSAYLGGDFLMPLRREIASTCRRVRVDDARCISSLGRGRISCPRHDASSYSLLLLPSCYRPPARHLRALHVGERVHDERGERDGPVSRARHGGGGHGRKEADKLKIGVPAATTV